MDWTGWGTPAHYKSILVETIGHHRLYPKTSASAISLLAMRDHRRTHLPLRDDLPLGLVTRLQVFLFTLGQPCAHGGLAVSAAQQLGDCGVDALERIPNCTTHRYGRKS